MRNHSSTRASKTGNKKIYVRDYSKKDVDGERLQVIKTYESMPHRYDYIFWISK